MWLRRFQMNSKLINNGRSINKTDETIEMKAEFVDDTADVEDIDDILNEDEDTDRRNLI